MVSLSTTGCATNSFRLNTAYADKAKADQVKVALAAAEKRVQEARRMPDWPAICDTLWHSGVQVKDGINVATWKGDVALGGANKQIIKCAAWYRKTQAAREPKP
ncbi:hypothetical protein NKI96_10825 [Mesorhizobium sp. M0292]|uniref:hypothetical protein n=1 Tax=Mesorhizobium sp. M0292 TaxID=2956929 RepID=UPI00333D81EB